jgi:hypothetical protein
MCAGTHMISTHVLYANWPQLLNTDFINMLTWNTMKSHLFIYFLLGKEFKFVTHNIKDSHRRHVGSETTLNAEFAYTCTVYGYITF